MVTETIDLPKTSFAFISDVMWVNQKPHPFVIGTRHVVYASDHCCGRLNEEAMRAVPCAHCHMPFDDHSKGDHVAFVKLTENVSQESLKNWLMSLSDWAADNKVDGFAFIRTEYNITTE